MSIIRQRALTPADERFLIVRTMIARCAPGLRTTSPTAGWHRLVGASQGIMVRPCSKRGVGARRNAGRS
jgi:hypothetical protein